MYCFAKLFFLAGCVLAVTAQPVNPPKPVNPPPPVFWRWNAPYGPQRRSGATADDGAYPEFLLNYFDAASLDRAPTAMGSYYRDNPDFWTTGTTTNGVSSDDSDSLVLGRRLKLSHGPRRKRSSRDHHT
jgi:hypothetical protein